MNDLFIIILFWMFLGAGMYALLLIFNVTQLRGGEYLKVFVICCIGGPLSGVAPLIYGHEEMKIKKKKEERK